MPSTPDSTPTISPKRFRISIGTVLLWFVIAGLVINTILLNRRISNIDQERESQKRELETIRPLPPAEVARQFEMRTTRGPISVKVSDVRYSPDSDSYKIEFSWTDSSTSKTWSSSVKLESDGYGTYYGKIRNTPYVESVGYKEYFTVAVQTPSPLAK